MCVRFVNFLDKYLEESLCSLCLIIMSCCIMLQVLLRFVFSEASAWAEELAIIGMVGGVYFGAALGVKNKAHLRIVVVVKLMPRFMQTPMIMLADLLWLGFMTFLLFQSARWMQLLFETNYIMPGLGIQQRWPQLIVPVALVLMILRMGQVYYRWFKGKEKELI